MKTVIFDMDGLLIDSEPMWQSAERQVFTSVGVNVSKELALQTACMTTREVTEFWFNHSPWQHRDLNQVENDVIDTVATLIQTQGKAMPGVEPTLELLRRHDCKIGLATNSPYRLIPVVLKKLGIEDFFDSIVSSEQVEHGKPRPDVYLTALDKLNASASEAVAIEDSASGLQAAKAATIKTVVVPASQQFEHASYDAADLKLRSLADFDTVHLQYLCNQS